METVLLTVQGLSVYTLSAFVFLAFLWSGFVFYKKGVEYHESEETMFNAVLLMGGLSFVFARAWFVLTRLDWFTGHWIRVFFMKEYPGMSGWGVFLGVLVGVLIMVKNLKKGLYDWLDLVSLGLSAGTPIVYVALGVLSVESAVVGVMAVETVKGLFLALWFLFLWWVEGEYRTFEWYRFRKTQARTGFVTGMFLIGFGLANLNAGLVVVGALVVYIRSERRIKKDLKLLYKKLKELRWPRIKRR